MRKPAPMPLLDVSFAPGYLQLKPFPTQDLSQNRYQAFRTHSIDDISSVSEMEDSVAATSPEQRSHRPRRRRLSAAEHIKHRRTRSGCLTCRQRRVKCDEFRPVCDRCRKGNRECTYPDDSALPKTTRIRVQVKRSSADSGSSPSIDEPNGNDERALPAVDDLDDEVMQHESESMSTTADEQSFYAASMVSEDSITLASPEIAVPHYFPSVLQTGRSASIQSVDASLSCNARWSDLPWDVQMLLIYHKENLSHYHYVFRSDRDHFLKTTLLDLAMSDQSEALLYAVVAFTSYHCTLAQQDAEISKFISYYNKSIVLLRQNLDSKKPCLTTLLTILQLATIEEVLGDWANLMVHQKAAHQIILDLYTPQTIMQDVTGRQTICWYLRFDLFARVIFGSQNRLSRPWFQASSEFYRRQTTEIPRDLPAKFDALFATAKLLFADFTRLMGEKLKNGVGSDSYRDQSRGLLVQQDDFREELESTIMKALGVDGASSQISPLEGPDLFDTQEPTFFYGGELYPMNYVLIDFWSSELMISRQVKQSESSDVAAIALKLCKLIDAMERSRETPPGGILCCQATLHVAVMFMPKDAKYTDWARSKLATMEKYGYLCPITLRQSMSEAWNVGVEELWAPGGRDGPAVLRALRDFVQVREEASIATLDIRVRETTGISLGQEVQLPRVL